MDEIKIMINGEELPIPSNYSVSLEDLDSDGSIRIITTGRLIRSRIRSEVIKISLSYNLNEMTDVFTILKMIRPATFTASLFLPQYGIVGEIEMYANKKGYDYIHTTNGMKAQSFSFDLTEV